MNKRFIFLFIICVLLTGAQTFAAPTDTPSTLDLSQYGYKDFLLIEAVPEIPQPGENVHIKIDSTTVDLNRSEITWSVNGITKIKQTGLKTFDVVAGKLGEKTTISATALTPQGIPITAKVSFIPGEVDLIWQADTYTPPFYKGKAMFTTQSDLQIVAIPFMATGNIVGKTGNNVYTWRHDGGIVGDKSGYGRNVLSLPSINLPRDVRIEVEATNYNNTGKAVGTLVIPPITPKALIYENQPRFGILLNRALVGDAYMEEQEIRLASFPYFFSSQTSNGHLKYEWSADNQNIPDFNMNTITLRNVDGKSGVSALHVVVNNSERFLQNVDTYLNLHFTNKKDKTPSF